MSGWVEVVLWGLSWVWMTWVWWRVRQTERVVERIVHVLGQAGPDLERRILEGSGSTFVSLGDHWTDENAFEEFEEEERV